MNGYYETREESTVYIGVHSSLEEGQEVLRAFWRAMDDYEMPKGWDLLAAPYICRGGNGTVISLVAGVCKIEYEGAPGFLTAKAVDWLWSTYEKKV